MRWVEEEVSGWCNGIGEGDVLEVCDVCGLFLIVL